MESCSLVLLSSAVPLQQLNPSMLGIAEPFPRTGIERDMVGVAGIVFGDGGQDVVVQGLLVVVHVLAVLIEHEKLAAQLQQVVGGSRSRSDRRPRNRSQTVCSGSAVKHSRIVRVVAGPRHAADAVHIAVSARFQKFSAIR